MNCSYILLFLSKLKQTPMKKTLILLSSATLLMACNEEPKVDYALFSGKIENKNSDKLIVRSGDFTKTIAVAEDGTFADTLRVDTGVYMFNDGKEISNVYLAPGYDLNLTLNTKEFDETIAYTGVGAEVNNYLASKSLHDEKLSSEIGTPELYALEEEEFLNKINEFNTSKTELLKNSGVLDEDFIAMETKNLKYDHLSNIQRYPTYHEYFAKKEGFKASDDFMKPLEGIDFTNEEDYNNIAAYKAMVQNHYSTKLNSGENVEATFKELSALNAPSIKKDLAKMLAYEVSPGNENLEAYYNGVSSLSDDQEFKDKLTEKYNKVKLLAKGNPSPEFTKYENHKGGTTSLSDLKGKYVYIDVWATWCGPCKREIPFLKEVEEQFHGKNIEFVSTSIDVAKDHDTWVEMVKEKELGGIQLFADNDWKSQFVQDYAIEGIPRFILVDPDGNIVSADAPRPSSPKLVELFKELSI